ncbi:MAG: hypothetical protein CMF59_16755 [Leptospiraceae bacterium]|nr:hypothetical protein [Leptospiraceae bacterium]
MEKEKKVTLRRLRQSLDLTCEERGNQYNTEHALVTMEATAAALGYTIVDDDPELVGWQPIETAPQHQWVIIAVDGYAPQIAVNHLRDEWNIGYHNDGEPVNSTHKPTHWMPIPPLPEGK